MGFVPVVVSQDFEVVGSILPLRFVGQQSAALAKPVLSTVSRNTSRVLRPDTSVALGPRSAAMEAAGHTAVLLYVECGCVVQCD